MEKGREPGTARFGNFINYYSFNPAENRLSLLPLADQLLQTIFSGRAKSDDRGLKVLDVGCNAGDLTVATYEYLSSLKKSEENAQSPSKSTATMTQSSISMLGVDLDEKLIERCISHNPYTENIRFEVADLLNESDRLDVVQHYLDENSRTEFDLVMCFSVTLWVHLNHGDQGLREFLSYLASCSRYLLIEPQPWKCYRTAVRRMKRSNCESFQHFPSLTWREKVDKQILEYLTDQCGLELVEEYGRTDWDRRVCLLRNTHVHQ